MTASIGYPTLRLVRVSVGKLNIDKLKPGLWVKVKKEDIL